LLFGRPIRLASEPSAHAAFEMRFDPHCHADVRIVGHNAPMTDQQVRRQDRLVQEAALADEIVVAEADGSPGPWWGFNGVNTLMATDSALWIATSVFAPRLPSGVRVRRIAREEITNLRHVNRRSMIPGRPRVTGLRFSAQQRSFSYTFNSTPEATALLSALRAAPEALAWTNRVSHRQGYKTIRSCRVEVCLHHAG
jgi:hypothetical protein